MDTTKPGADDATTPPRHTARAILIDGTSLILIKRLQPRRDPLPYWVTPGGDIEPGDDDAQAAMRREVAEELGATTGPARQVLVLDEPKPDGIRHCFFFLTTLTSMDPAARTGAEFDDPARGTYDLERIPLTAAGLAAIRLLPEPLADWLTGNAADLLRQAATLTGQAA
jgi:8-oxo-dGTP pyrophosphatase MutT (NUDIX family)